MAAFVALVALDGSAIQVNPEQVCALLPVPAALLPVGVANGTYVDLQGNADGGSGRVGVQGTVAATAAALLSGAGGANRVAVGTIVVNMTGGGSVVFADGVMVGATVDDSVIGTCVVTQALASPLPANSIIILTPLVVPIAVAQDGPVTLTGFQVKAWTTTDGLAADGGFIAMVFAPV